MMFISINHAHIHASRCITRFRAHTRGTMESFEAHYEWEETSACVCSHFCYASIQSNNERSFYMKLRVNHVHVLNLLKGVLVLATLTSMWLLAVGIATHDKELEVWGIILSFPAIIYCTIPIISSITVLVMWGIRWLRRHCFR